MSDQSLTSVVVLEYSQSVVVMSHQTGIRANDDLKRIFGKCRDGGVRALKIIIDNEELTLDRQYDSSGAWDQDFDKIVPRCIREDQPCYILYRLDSKDTSGYEWLFITWSPDSAAVRQKMLYASTKATLKQEFGTSHLKDELFCSVKEDATLAGYIKHQKGEMAPAPLTDREEALRALTINDHTDTYNPDSRQQTMGGVAFPMTNAARDALINMLHGKYDYLQFKIDVDEERIHLAKAENITLKDLPNQVPTDAARYHLYMFKHSHEGDHLENIVFIYSMPGYNCSIKERMLYSSCKGPFLENISQLGIEVVKKIEIDEGKELTEEFLQEEIHPKRNLHRPTFAKPKGPPNRGAKRITKPQES